jgi:hypothetical protein
MVITTEKKVYEFYVAGVQHHGLKDVIGELYEGIELSLELEPTNQYDATAVKILFDPKDSLNLVMIGYVPGKMSAEVTDFIVKAILPICEVTRLSPESKPWQQIMVKIYDDGEL